MTLLNARSRVSVVRKWLVASTASAAAQELAAIACARHPPLASRAMSPALTIDATPASAAGARSASSERGAIAFIVHATTGVSSGWSVSAMRSNVERDGRGVFQPVGHRRDRGNGAMRRYSHELAGGVFRDVQVSVCGKREIVGLDAAELHVNWPGGTSAADRDREDVRRRRVRDIDKAVADFSPFAPGSGKLR
jgi:hypothetical protein